MTWRKRLADRPPTGDWWRRRHHCSDVVLGERRLTDAQWDQVRMENDPVEAIKRAKQRDDKRYSCHCNECLGCIETAVPICGFCRGGLHAGER